jgi:hypothetical protein
MPIFTRSPRGSQAPSQLDQIVQSLTAAHVASPLTNSKVSTSALSMESIDDSGVQLIRKTSVALESTIENIAATLGLGKDLTAAQKEAGTAAGIVAGDLKAFFNTPVKSANIATESMATVRVNVGDAMESRPGSFLSMEAYNDNENRNAAIYSIAYNMQSARQDEFGETLFPTIVVTQDQAGFAITVRLLQVYEDLKRNISGNLDDYQKKNLIRAIADPTILKNDSTRVFPVYRDQSKDKFVDSALVAPRDIVWEGEKIHTAPLAIGKQLSLLGISATDTLLANGQPDITDSLDTAISLQAIYVQVGDDVLKFDTVNLPLANFTYATQNDYRVMQLNFDSTSVLINKDTKRADGSALTTLKPIVDGDLILRIHTALAGTVNIEETKTVVYGNDFSVFTVQNSAGELLDLASAGAKPVVDLFATAKIIGYDLKAYRSNANRRERGQLINVTHYTQLYNINLRAPITSIHPVTTDGTTDTSDLTALVTATRIRTSNAAVTALIEAAQMLKNYVVAKDYVGLPPDVLGVGRFFVRPAFEPAKIDMATAVDSIKSQDRAADIQAVLVNKCRDMAYRMYRDSEYKAAADALAGGAAPVPEVILATDPVLARYLNVTGDLRTLGGEFNVRVVSTLDVRVQGKIFLTFGVFDENRNVAPNPLNFGNMAWSPEVTVVLPIARNGQISRELAVTPRFLHTVNLPILGVIEVDNVPDVLNKVEIYTKSV